MTTEQYICLIEKKNGKIIKNEQYPIEMLDDFKIDLLSEPLIKSGLSFFQRLFKINLDKELTIACNLAKNKQIDLLKYRFKYMVDEDEGKKKKR